MPNSMKCSNCRRDQPVAMFRPGRDADVCGRCRYGSLNFGMADERAYQVRKADHQFENVDGPAYWRLKKDGIQPNNIDGSHLLETMMEHPMEAELGTNLLPEEKAALIREGM